MKPHFFLTLLLCLFVLIQCTGQSGKTQHITLLQGEEKIELNVRSENPKPTVHIDRFYHWFQLRNIHKTQGDFQGQLLHGDYVVHAANGQLKEKGAFSNGLKDGKWKSWHANGNIKQTSNWRNGERHGICIQYDETGKKQSIAHYRKNLLHGAFLTFENDSLLLEQHYRNGVQADQKSKKEREKKVKKQPVPEPSATKK